MKESVVTFGKTEFLVIWTIYFYHLPIALCTQCFSDIVSAHRIMSSIERGYEVFNADENLEVRII